MPIDPFIEPLLANLPPFPDTIDDFPAWRQQEEAGAEALVQQLAEPGPQIRSQRVVKIPVDGGTIDLKIFQPFGEGYPDR